MTWELSKSSCLIVFEGKRVSTTRCLIMELKNIVPNRSYHILKVRKKKVITVLPRALKTILSQFMDKLTMMFQGKRLFLC